MFILLTDKAHLVSEAETYLRDHLGLPFTEDVLSNVVNKPHNYPCLVTFYEVVTFNGKRVAGTLICHRNIAKSLVYHKTNKCGFYNWWRVSNVEDLKALIAEVAAKYKKNPSIRCTPSLRDFTRIKFPVLLTVITSYRDNVVLNFFAVTMPEAKRLIYAHKDRLRTSKVSKVLKSFFNNPGPSTTRCNDIGPDCGAEAAEVEVAEPAPSFDEVSVSSYGSTGYGTVIEYRVLCSACSCVVVTRDTLAGVCTRCGKILRVNMFTLDRKREQLIIGRGRVREDDIPF
jgi:hypothetical protein